MKQLIAKRRPRASPHRQESASRLPGPEPTPQQQSVVAQTVAKGEILLLNAYAGSGKTTTLEMVARAHPELRFLYLCFNRDNANEARERFPRNCECSTIHSKAWHAVGKHYAPGHVRPRTVMEAFKLSAPYLAVYVIDTLNTFLHSIEERPEQSHITTGPGTPDPVRHLVLSTARKLWRRMQDRNDPEIPMTHDGYLKLWAMQQPSLPGYDLIFLDEAQDTNPVTLEVVLQQAHDGNAGVILVGDSHQSIYAWRHAIDAIDQVAERATRRLPLTECFRFGPGIAHDASIVLNELKSDPVQLIGRGQATGKPESFAVLARTNANLIASALEKASAGRRIHFAATNAGDGWDPFVPYKFQLTLDIFHLWNDEAPRVRDSYMKKFRSFEEVEEHARGEGAERHGRDIELALQIELVKEHGEALPSLLELLRHQSGGPADADLTFSTVHRAKGQEWDAVHILDDFINPSDQESLKGLDKVSRDEEFNILYVAITRARQKILYPPDLLEWIEEFTEEQIDTQHRLEPERDASQGQNKVT